MATWTNADTARTSTISATGRRLFGRSIASFQRPANVTPYTKYDVVGWADTGETTGASGCLGFPSCATANGGSGVIRKVMLSIDDNTTDSDGNPPSFVLHIFDEEPTNRADGDAVNFQDADLPKLICSVELTNAQSLVVNSGTSPAGALLYVADVPSFHASYVCEAAAKVLYGHLVVDSTSWTPANAGKFVITLDLDMD